MSRRGKWAAGAGSGALIDLGVVFFHQAVRGAGRRKLLTSSFAGGGQDWRVLTDMR